MKRIYKLLLVEDSDDDVILFDLALKRAGRQENFRVIGRIDNGEDAATQLPALCIGADPERRPDVVLLDVKLPGRSGFEVLAEMAKIPGRPVIGVFTSSSLEEEKKKAYDLARRFLSNENLRCSGVCGIS